MNSQKFQDELVVALQAFRTEHGLASAWESELLLVMAPQSDSQSVRVCISFEPSYWSARTSHSSRKRSQLKLIEQLDNCCEALHSLARDDLFAIHVDPFPLSKQI